MLRIKCIALVIAAAALFSGCAKESAAFGSNVSPKGLITQISLDYTFTYNGSGSFADLCNHVYFQGDTVCFSFDFKGDVSGKPDVWFIDTLTGRKKTAERIEVIKSRVWGFSLTGSLLEFYQNNRLGEKLDGERKFEQPFMVRVEAVVNGKKTVQEKEGKFSVSF